MAGKRNTKVWRARKKAIGNAPKWLKTVQISKTPRKAVSGTFGAASPVVSIDPATGLPKEAA